MGLEVQGEPSDYALVKAYLANPMDPAHQRRLVVRIYGHVARWPKDTQQDVLFKLMIPTRPEYLRRWAEQVERDYADPETRDKASLGPYLEEIAKNKTIDKERPSKNKIFRCYDALHVSKKEGGRPLEDSVPGNGSDVATSVGLKGFLAYLRQLRRKNPSKRQVEEIGKVRFWVLCVLLWDMETAHIVDHEPRGFEKLKGERGGWNIHEFARYQRFELFRALYAEKYKLHNTVMNAKGQVNPGAISVVVAKYLRLYAQDEATEALAAK